MSSTALAPFTPYQLAPSAPVGWTGTSALVLPPLGNLDAYISAVNRLPLLTAEEEHDYAQRLQQRQAVDGADVGV